MQLERGATACTHWCSVQAGQTFDPASRSALNRGDLIPGLLSVQASGTYEPQVQLALKSTLRCLAPY